MEFDCKIEEQSSQPTLSIRSHVPVTQLPQTIGKSYEAILEYLTRVNEYPVGPPFVAYYNMDIENLEIEAGFPVEKALTGDENVQPGVIPAGKLASCMYTGPYDEMRPAYDALSRYIIDSGYEATGVAYEFYLNDPINTAPEQLLTMIVFPLK